MLKLNIGGKIFTTTKDTLTRYGPNKFTEDLEYNKTQYIFFDRDPTYFHLILNHLRGYSIKLPETAEDLHLIYQDVQFYNIYSLKQQIEKLFNPEMSVDEKKILIETLKKKIYELKMDNLKGVTIYMEKLSDKELLTLKDQIFKYEAEVVTRTYEQNIFESCLFILRYFEKTHNFKDLCSRFMSNANIAKKIISSIVAKHDKDTIHLLTFLISILFDKTEFQPTTTHTSMIVAQSQPTLGQSSMGSSSLGQSSMGSSTMWRSVVAKK